MDEIMMKIEQERIEPCNCGKKPSFRTYINDATGQIHYLVICTNNQCFNKIEVSPKEIKSWLEDQWNNKQLFNKKYIKQVQ